LPEEGKRVEFAVNFLAALIALSKCRTACITTGNVALWLCYSGETWTGFGNITGANENIKNY